MSPGERDPGPRGGQGRGDRLLSTFSPPLVTRHFILHPSGTAGIAQLFSTGNQRLWEAPLEIVEGIWFRCQSGCLKQRGWLQDGVIVVINKN